MAQVTYIASSAVTYSNSTSGGCDKPTGTADGDILFLHVVFDAAGGSVSTPSGWTLIDAQGSSPVSYLFYKIASSEGASYSFTKGGTQGSSQCISTFRNSPPTNPIDQHSVARNASSATITGTAITPTMSPDEILIAFMGWNGTSGATSSAYAVATSNPTWTEGYQGGTGANPAVQISMAYANRNFLTSTGAFTASLTATRDNAVHLICVKSLFTFLPPVLAMVDTLVPPTPSLAASFSVPVLNEINTLQAPTVKEADLKWTNVQKNSSTWTNEQKS